MTLNVLTKYQKSAQVLGIIVALSISGSVFQNMALKYLASALPQATAFELGQLVTGTSGAFYKSLGPAEKHLVVQQVTAAIRDSFYYLCGVTALGFITSLSLSVSSLYLFRTDRQPVTQLTDFPMTAKEAVPHEWRDSPLTPSKCTL